MLGFAKSPQFFYKANTAVAVDTLYSIKYTLETASLLGPQTIATGIWVSVIKLFLYCTATKWLQLCLKLIINEES